MRGRSGPSTQIHATLLLEGAQCTTAENGQTARAGLWIALDPAAYVQLREELTKLRDNLFNVALSNPHHRVPVGLCLVSEVTERVDSPIVISTSLEEVKGRVLSEFARTFLDRAINFARGSRFRRFGRAPYLNLLHWLARSEEWSCSISHELAKHADIRGSVSQVVDKGYLERFLNEHEELRDLFHYDSYTRVLAVEDPNFMYFLTKPAFVKICQTSRLSFSNISV